MATAETTRFNKTSYDGGESGGKKSEYGYLTVMKTIGGGEVHWDSTPGGERCFVMHPRGGFTEVNFRGDEIKMVIGDCKNYYKSGMNSTTDENKDCMSVGHSRCLGGGSSTVEYAGEVQICMGGDTAVCGMKNVNVRAKSLYFASDTNINIHADKDLGIRVEGNMKVMVDGDMELTAKGATKINGETINLNSKNSSISGSGSGLTS